VSAANIDGFRKTTLINGIVRVQFCGIE
jgi:hypothetical protein